MKYLYAIILFATAPFIHAQETQAVKPERLKSFYIAPSFGLEIINIKNQTTDALGYPVTYKGKPSVRIGLDIAYKQSKSLLFNAGFFYAAKNFDRTQVHQELGTDYYNSQFKTGYYEVLGGATYNFIVGRFDIGAYANLNFAFLNKAKEIRETESGNSFTFNVKGSQHKVLTILEPGLNFNYNMTYRLSFNLRTGYRIYTHSMNEAGLYKNSGILIQPGLFYMF